MGMNESNCVNVMTSLRESCISCRECSIGGREIGDNLSNVFSTMNFMADIMVVGQCPGLDEVNSGLPFVGHAGQIFDESLKRLTGISRSDVYITNVVKCYTCKRKPRVSEVDSCRKYLDMEMKIVSPKVVVAVGGFAFKAMTGMGGIIKHCGEVIMSPRYGVPVIAVIHPSNDSDKSEMFEGAIKKIGEVLCG